MCELSLLAANSRGNTGPKPLDIPYTHVAGHSWLARYNPPKIDDHIIKSGWTTFDHSGADFSIGTIKTQTSSTLGTAKLSSWDTNPAHRITVSSTNPPIIRSAFETRSFPQGQKVSPMRLDTEEEGELERQAHDHAWMERISTQDGSKK